ncbi:hypothetical protein ESCO_004925 [Escovopsis weberi]|uniref:Uncharacterized protein n=1 Tax=Escovopsis weberi TaxID=150374 RepID=A0A0M9VRX8_ESCWE|nr:hypothetical protein ESCO_004925 [Escovopsis weberi]
MAEIPTTTDVHSRRNPSAKEHPTLPYRGDVWPCDDCCFFKPSPIDIEVVRAMLIKARRLPPHVLDMVFDFAEYWAHSTTVLRTLPHVYGSDVSENSFLLRSYPVGLVNLGGDEDAVPIKEVSYISSRVTLRPLGRRHEAATFARLAKYPTPRLMSPVRKVVFSVRSKDQGWGGVDSTSWTWFDAGLEMFDADHTGGEGRSGAASEWAPLSLGALRSVHPEPQPIQPDGLQYHYVCPLSPEDGYLVVRNRLKEREWRNHVITWSYLDDIDPCSEAGVKLEEEGRGRATGNGKFVRDLRLGDVVTLWGKARFPGWANHIMEARIDIFWAI